MFQSMRATLMRRKYLWLFTAAIAAAPVLLLAYPMGSPAGYTGAPLSAVDFGDCTHCHGGTATSGGVTVSGFPTGLTYTPGVTQHLTVTVPPSTSGKGFQLTARLSSNTVTPEGTLTSTDANTSVITSSGVPFIGQTSMGSASNTFHFDWTPPSSNVGDITFYVAGVAGYANVYKASYTLTPAAPAPPPQPNLSANPPSLTFAYLVGSSTMPGSQTFTVSSSDGSPVSFTANASTTSGGNWLSVSPTGGVTGSSGAVTVTVIPTGLSANTYSGTVTINSAAAANKLTVGVTLTVTAPPPPAGASLSVSPTSLTFTARKLPASQTVTVGSSGAAITYAVTANTTAGEPAWLSASCASSACTTPDTVTVSVSNIAGLAPGVHYGSIKLTPSDASIAEVTIPVKVRVPKH